MTMERTQGDGSAVSLTSVTGPGDNDTAEPSETAEEWLL